MRRIFTYALAAIAAAFLWALVVIPNTYAADATWNSTSSISYGSNTYSGPASATTVQELGLPENTEAYTFVDPAPTGTGTSTANTSQKIHVIYFTSSADANTATSAKYETYTYQGPDSFTNPSSPTNISTDQQSAASSKGTTSCVVEGGLGWIICPVTNLLANGMDTVFGIISGFLTVRPVGTGQETALFRAWTYMRSFANVAFVMAFLVIIYSQLTNFGISNYGIKKLLPRIIIAAILVNISYYICAMAVDVSNILGYGIQEAFISMRNGLVGAEGNSWDLISWKSITGFILSGGTAAAVGTIGLATTLSTYGILGSIFLLIPTLLVGILAVLTALLIMAARQAIITILIIIAPLAFVAYLLPNTEKWFEKWRSTLMTLLILFPAFSVVYGGSQLAAAAIIQNADSINIVILGMLVQVAPLFVTPLLINLSGSLLGKIASVVNSPNKAIVDRTRKFSDERAGNVAAKRLARNLKPIDTSTKLGKIRRYTPGMRLAQTLDHNRRARETQKKIHEGMADNRFSDSADNQRFHQEAYNVETDKKMIEQRLERGLNTKIRVTPELLNKEMKMRVVTDEASVAKARLDKIHEDLRGGKDTSGALSALVNRSETATRDLALTAIANQTAKRVQQSNLSSALLKNNERIDGQLLRDYAGGIDENGADSALAFAVKEQRESMVKSTAERAQLMNHFKLSGGQYQRLATKQGAVVGVDSTGNRYTFNLDDDYSIEAAIQNQLSTGSFDEKFEIITKSGIGGTLENFRSSISKAIPANGIPNSASSLGGKFIDDVIRGLVTGRDYVIESTAEFIADGKVKDEVLANNDPGSIKLFLEAAQKGEQLVKPEKRANFRNNVKKLLETAKSITDDKYEGYDVRLAHQASSGTIDELKELIQKLSK